MGRVEKADDGSVMLLDENVPSAFDFYWDNQVCYQLLESIRWRDHKKCPRCDSEFTREVNTTVFRELFRCIDCGYMFNTLSGTVFQGTKIALPKFFQLFTLYDAFGASVTSREVSYIIDVSQKTAIAMLGKMGEMKITSHFTSIDRERATALKDSLVPSPAAAAYGNFFLYCEMRHIIVSRSRFLDYLKDVLSWERVDLPLPAKRAKT